MLHVEGRLEQQALCALHARVGALQSQLRHAEREKHRIETENQRLLRELRGGAAEDSRSRQTR